MIAGVSIVFVNKSKKSPALSTIVRHHFLFIMPKLLFLITPDFLYKGQIYLSLIKINFELKSMQSLIG